jgi:hypothetical protein
VEWMMEDIVPERAMTALPSNLINQPTDKALARVLARLRSPQTLTPGKNWNASPTYCSARLTSRSVHHDVI